MLIEGVGPVVEKKKKKKQAKLEKLVLKVRHPKLYRKPALLPNWI